MTGDPRGTAGGAVIETARPFLDQHGRFAQLHGVGILRIGDRFFAWGEDKRAGGTFAGIACYSSADLATWRHEGTSLEPGHGDLAPGRVVERPKVLRHPRTGRYVLLVHVDSADYADARVGFASSSDPIGPYEYHGSVRPLGNASRDIGVYMEEDTGYLLSEDRERGLHLYRLTEDLLAVDALVATTLGERGDHGYESPALVRVGGTYYLFGSDLTGWATNDNRYATAPALAGPWSPWRRFAPAGSATYDSQISTIATIAGTEHTTYVYIGDRWRPDRLERSLPVWMPIRIGDGQARLDWVDRWSVDIASGAVRAAGPARAAAGNAASAEASPTTHEGAGAVASTRAEVADA
ncbi:family 43 glycosylhydrolase [Streptomyces sp. NBC_00448]|uniref:family 43 glycosylhydrolase n=1 Tax=Streptomyces sp. NBC_00448 TaxID=2903652 RepID=UPI002E1B61FB